MRSTWTAMIVALICVVATAGVSVAGSGGTSGGSAAVAQYVGNGKHPHKKKPKKHKSTAKKHAHKPAKKHKSTKSHKGPKTHKAH